jgi:hypothetical protein
VHRFPNNNFADTIKHIRFDVNILIKAESIDIIKMIISINNNNNNNSSNYYYKNQIIVFRATVYFKRL